MKADTEPARAETTVEAVIAGLRREWGVQFPTVAPVLRVLASGRPASVERLVLESGLSHRSTVELLRRLEPWLAGAREQHQLVPAARPAVLAALAAARPPAPAEAELLDAVTRLVGRAPARRRELDHVVATPETCAARARYLAERYDLTGAGVLFLGDHDLTSLALALLAPEARIAVVDYDDDVLAYVDRSARELGREVATYFSDLRVGLPRALEGAADLVFTDPPYTPDGVRLFAARACAALRRDERSRLLLCHGYGERQPALGQKVQASLHALRLVYEAMLPGFNRYLGAAAIGSRSALHVLRPVAATWRALEREPDAPATIYTHRGQATEARRPALPAPVQDAALEWLGAAGEGWLAGEGWSARAGEARTLSVAALWRLLEQHATAAPAHLPALPDAIAVDLLDSAPLAVRLLLAGRCRRLLLVVPAREAHAVLGRRSGPGRLLGAAYALREAGTHGGIALLEAVARAEDPPASAEERLARDLVRHPAGAVGNVLREALVRAAEAGGGHLTRNEAREVVARHVAPWAGQRTVDLPRHALEELADALPGLVR